MPRMERVGRVGQDGRVGQALGVCQGRPAGRPYIGKIPQTIINMSCQRSDWGILEGGSRFAARDDNRECQTNQRSIP